MTEAMKARRAELSRRVDLINEAGRLEGLLERMDGDHEVWIIRAYKTGGEYTIPDSFVQLLRGVVVQRIDMLNRDACA